MAANAAGSVAAKGRTLAEKVWEAHLVRRAEGEPDLLYIDMHFVHEVTSAQAFDGLRLAGRPVRRPDLTIATEDHNTPTLEIDKRSPIPSRAPRSRRCAATAPSSASGCTRSATRNRAWCTSIGRSSASPARMTIVCGDSHTSTHGAFGALAFGIGTSEVEHVLATQTLPLKPFKTMAVNVTAGCSPASRPRTSSWRSSRRSAPAAGRATCSNTAARRSAGCPWKAG